MFKSRTSLRFKLTFWMVVIWGVIHSSLTLVVWLYERGSVDSFFRGRLHNIATLVTQEISAMPHPVREVDLQRIASKYSSTGLYDEIVLVLYRPDGGVHSATREPGPNMHGLEAEFRKLASGAGKTEADTRMHMPPTRLVDGQRIRTIAMHMPGQHYPDHLLVIGSAESYSVQIGSQFAEVLLASIIAGLLGATVGASVISGLITSPLSRLSETLQGLAPHTVGESVSFDDESSELTTIRRELDAVRSRMEEGFRAQERFISNVSHEIKTPISVLITEAQTLPPLYGGKPEVEEFVESVIRELRILGNTVDSFLLLTRVRHGKPLAAIMSSYLVNELVLDCVDSCYDMAKLHSVGLSVSLLSDEKDLDLTVHGVPDLLRTMLDNLVRNAIRFTPNGSAVEISVHRHNQQVVFFVRDYGPGIPPSLINILFDRFVQAEQEERRGRGNGLGLAIAQGIAELHGGHISAENCEEGGCRFMVALPLPTPNGDSKADHDESDGERERSADR